MVKFGVFVLPGKHDTPTEVQFIMEEFTLRFTVSARWRGGCRIPQNSEFGYICGFPRIFGQTPVFFVPIKLVLGMDDGRV